MSKKPKLTREEKAQIKAEKKAEKRVRNSTPEAIETKQTVIKAVTAVICVVALCASSTSAIGKYCEALTKSAEFKGSQVQTSGTGYTGGGAGTVATPSTGDDITVPADGTTDPSAPADETQTPADGNSAEGTASKDPTTFNKAQVVEYYNKCLKEAYSKKVKMNRTETISIKVDEASGGNVVVNFVNNTILPKYAGTKNEERTLNGTKEDLEQRGPNFASPYKLTPDGAKTAVITKNGANYEIVIVTVAESSTLDNPPKINTACAHPLNLNKVDISPAKVTKADFTYPGTTLKATVDASGKVLKTSIVQPLSGTGEGKLGITLHATLSGSLDQSVTYTYL